MTGPSANGRVALMCTAHALSMLGFATWPTLLPQLQPLWGLSSTEAGLVSGVFFAGFMALVPFLSGLTDRMDARRIYLASTLVAATGAGGFAVFATGTASAMAFQFLLGAGIAGTYMPGLKLLTDHAAGPRQSRSVSFYTATFGTGTGLSILIAGTVAANFGWQSAFLLSSVGPLVAGALVWLWMPPGHVHAGTDSRAERLRAVFTQRDAVRYIYGYAVHCWELFGSRSWLVAFLTFATVAAASPAAVPPGFSPVMVAGMANLLVSPLASIAGNELSLRFGRERVIWNTMLVSALLTSLLGFMSGLPWPLLAALALLHMFAVMGDSASLTSGMVGASAPHLRGASMAVHATLGFGAGFAGPLLFGVVLDVSGGNADPAAWGWAFASLALPAMLGSFVLRRRNGADAGTGTGTGADAGADAGTDAGTDIRA